MTVTRQRQTLKEKPGVAPDPPPARRKQPEDKAAASSPEATIGRKVAKVVASAWVLFNKDGFQTTSMDAIASEAGVSKATLYAYFPSKQALFAHLIVQECQRTISLLTMPDLSLGIEPALRSFAKQYTRMFIEEAPHHMAFFKILVTEASRFPELGQLMIDSGPKADTERLAGLLAEATRLKLLDISDPTMAATQFLCLVRGELPIQSALGLSPTWAEGLDRTIEAGLRLFLKAYEPRAGAGEGLVKNVDT